MPRRIVIPLANYLHSGGKRAIYVVLAIIFPLLIGVGCWLDGTWRMSSADKGFTQYYGFWAIFVTTPIVLILTSFLVDNFIASIQKPETYCANLTGEIRRRIDRLVTRHVQSLSLQSRSVWIFVFIAVVLIFWWVFNVTHTISPVPKQIFNHDVFDSSAHPFGFYLTRSYVLFMFLCVYCPAIFVALHVTASMVSILKLLCDDDILLINFFHPGNCGGTSPFGRINLLILGIYANFFLIIYAMYMTHGQAYLVITVSLIACSVLAVVQSVVAVYYIHKAIAQKKPHTSRQLRTA